MYLNNQDLLKTPCLFLSAGPAVRKAAVRPGFPELPEFNGKRAVLKLNTGANRLTRHAGLKGGDSHLW